MRGTLPAAGLLHLWERAEALPPVERALCLAAATGADPDALRAEPYGRTNDRVLALREELLGPALEATASCPACAAVVEFALDTTVLRAQRPGPPGATETYDEVAVDWRAPTPADLGGITAEPHPGRALQERCLSSRLLVDELPAALVAQVEQAMADADPLGEVLARLTCPDCEAAFEAELDVAAFVWVEVDASAQRLLHEVDVLARAYGWTESEVLALSERRRSAYLRIVLDGAL